MKTTMLLSGSDEDLKTAADIIKNGQVVGMPTETVYGLAADAENPEAVKKVFEAKGRPADNPLIVHICKIEDITLVAHDIPSLAYKLAEHFWPGPFTMILPKNDNIPYITSGGLETVGIRLPLDKTARRFIQLSGKLIAAPSANRSGYPSPTLAKHVMDDMNGRIEAVIDGGACSLGLESTVISFEGDNTIRILRPGFVTKEDVEAIGVNVIMDRAITEQISAEVKATSPGMKYKHYSPTADVVIVDGDYENFVRFFKEHNDENTYGLIYDSEAEKFPFKYMTYGDTAALQGQYLFARLREFDDMGVKKVYVRMPHKDGVGIAVYNRLIRAAGFEVIKV